MAKANIETSKGTKITIDGSPEEIAKILNLVEGKSTYSGQKKGIHTGKDKMKPKTGLTGYIRELKDEGFFTKPKDLSSIKEELDTRAHIYPVTSIQPVLTKMVQNRELGRLKENSRWVYVQR